VRGSSGPEAGVWVIAETTDLPTRFARMVVTDDQGRYVIPDLPKANYKVWVRGYGLVDSAKVDSAPGKILDLTAVPAPSAADAAQYYPAIYWYSMLKIPDEGQSAARATSLRRLAGTTGLPRSRTATASAATSWASWQRVPFPGHSVSSSRGRRRGYGACSRDRQQRTW
jgi:hypothetical protein